MFDDLTLEAWVRRLDEDRIRYDYDMTTVLELHEALHRVFGDVPNEAIIPGEQRLSQYLSQRGFPHRKKDELSRAAGTYIENPPPPDAYEYRYYTNESLVLFSGATILMADAAKLGDVYVHIDETAIPGMASAILKVLNRKLPPELKLKVAPKNWKADFVQIMPLHDLSLTSSYDSVKTQLWETVRAQIRKEASAAASTVWKEDQDPVLHPQVVHKSVSTVDDSLFVLGRVMSPGKIDKTQSQLNDGRVTKGDITTAEDVEKAAHWWAANSPRFSLGHVMLGGKPMGDEDIKMVENTIHRGPDWPLPDGRVISAGDWLAGARVFSDEAKEAFLSGKANAWSIGAKMAYEVMEVEDTSLA